MPDRLRRTWPAVLVATLLAVLAFPTAAQSAPTRCPGTFEVLHNDHIGRLSLPAGPYVIDVLDSSRLSCASASDLFRQFLEDFDGRLPRPWVLNVSSRTFTRGSGSTTGFQVTRWWGGGGGGGGRHPATGLACPGFFHVLHNDHIGRLRLPAGEYRITLLSLNRISCARASRYFAQFLQDFDGRLPQPWVLDVETGSFMRGSRNVGFRVKPTGAPPNPNTGGGRNPPRGQRRCPGTFRVLHRDRIGRLRLPAGRYLITLLSNRLSCRSASRRFSQFLDNPSGRLPRPWVLNTGTGTFSRGRGSRTGFRVKPARAR
jgi:hypothetical protein